MRISMRSTIRPARSRAREQPASSGSSRSAPVSRSTRATLAIAERTTACRRRGRHPSAPGRGRRVGSRSWRPPHRRPGRRDRRDRARLLPRLRAARRRSAASSPRSSRLARRARPGRDRALRARPTRRPCRSSRQCSTAPSSCTASRRPRCCPPLSSDGYYVSFAGNVTYPKAVGAAGGGAQIPQDRLLAETDCPYLAPQPVRGKTNEPAYVVHTVAALAEARGEDADELAPRIDANAAAAFGLP